MDEKDTQRKEISMTNDELVEKVGYSSSDYTLTSVHSALHEDKITVILEKKDGK